MLGGQENCTVAYGKGHAGPGNKGLVLPVVDMDQQNEGVRIVAGLRLKTLVLFF